MFANGALFAVAASAIAIPIAIHLLLRQRRKPIAWAAMRFLLEAYRKHRRILTIQQWLLLACRCLILLFLALGLGRLLADAGRDRSTGETTLYFLIDTSIASKARPVSDGDGRPADTYFDRHITEARRLIRERLTSSDAVAVIDLSSPPSFLLEPTQTDPAAAARLLDRLRPTDARADLPAALRLIADAEAARADGGPAVPNNAGDSAATDVEIHVLSAFHAGSADLAQPLPPALDPLAAERTVRIRTSRLAADAADNVTVVSVEPLERLLLASDAARVRQVTVELRRSGALPAETTSLSIAPSDAPDDADVFDAPAAARVAQPTAVRWNADQTQVRVTIDAELARSNVADDDARGRTILVARSGRDGALAADDARAAPVVSLDAVRVGLIGPRRFGGGPSVASFTAADWLRAALRPGDDDDDTPPVSIVPLSPAAVDDVGLAGLDAAVLPTPHLLSDTAWDALARFTADGGVLLLAPAAGESLHAWTDSFTDAFGLPWRFEAEPLARDDTAIDTSGGETHPLLRLIAGELAELARPVRVSRALTPDRTADAAQQDAATPDADANTLFPDPDVVLRLEDGDPWLLAARPTLATPGAATDAGSEPNARASGRGLVFMLTSAVDPQWTNLPLMPLMVPLTQEIVRRGVGEAAAEPQALAGVSLPVPVGATDVLTPRRQQALADRTRFVAQHAGRYLFRDPAGRTLASAIVNPDPAGSLLTPTDPDRLTAWLAGAAPQSDRLSVRVDPGDAERPGADDEATTTDRAERTPFDAVFLALAAAFALLETVLAKFFSHARLNRVDDADAHANGGRS